MRISKSELRMLVESFLLEGFKNDQRDLVKKYPERERDLSALPPKWISWLAARFGENVTASSNHIRLEVDKCGCS